MVSQERLGTSRNVINRVLQDLKAKNLIRLSRGKIPQNLVKFKNLNLRRAVS
nr:hypothetical protein [uncultured Campylobacter sp.]